MVEGEGETAAKAELHRGLEQPAKRAALILDEQES